MTLKLPAAKVCCPLCGQQVSLPLLLDPESSRVVTAAGAVHLTPQEFVFLDELVRRYPGLARDGAVLDALYGMRDEPAHGEKSLRILAFKIRRKLGAAGLTLERVMRSYGLRDGGYRLVAGEAPPSKRGAAA